MPLRSLRRHADQDHRELGDPWVHRPGRQLAQARRRLGALRELRGSGARAPLRRPPRKGSFGGTGAARRDRGRVRGQAALRRGTRIRRQPAAAAGVVPRARRSRAGPLRASATPRPGGQASHASLSSTRSLRSLSSGSSAPTRRAGEHATRPARAGRLARRTAPSGPPWRRTVPASGPSVPGLPGRHVLLRRPAAGSRARLPTS